MLFESLDKLRRNSILSAILLAALGAVILICPVTYVPVLILVLGYLLIIIAIVMLLYFLSGNKSLMEYIKFVCALIVALAGICVLVFRDDVARVLTVLFGCLLILDGGRTVFHSVMYSRRSQRKGWWVLTVLSALLILAGLILLVKPPWETPAELMKVIGCAVFFAAVVSALRLLWTWPLNTTKGGNDNGEG